MLFFRVKEGEAVEPDHAVCDAAFGKAGRDGFGDTDYNLWRRREVSRKLKERVKGRGRPTIVGRMYVSAPVSSNIMTTTETVICMIPLRAAPAPRNAYVPGVMHGTSG